MLPLFLGLRSGGRAEDEAAVGEDADADVLSPYPTATDACWLGWRDRERIRLMTGRRCRRFHSADRKKVPPRLASLGSTVLFQPLFVVENRSHVCISATG